MYLEYSGDGQRPCNQRWRYRHHHGRDSGGHYWSDAHHTGPVLHHVWEEQETHQ